MCLKSREFLLFFFDDIFNQNYLSEFDTTLRNRYVNKELRTSLFSLLNKTGSKFFSNKNKINLRALVYQEKRIYRLKNKNSESNSTYRYEYPITYICFIIECIN